MEVLRQARYEDTVSAESQFFRANVGAVLCNRLGQVLGFERSDVSGAWQLPQGGIEPGEEPDRAVLREIAEETGLDPALLEPRGRHPGLLAYELPAHMRSPKTGRGQVQYWFYFLVRAGGVPELPPGGEFRAVQWMELRDLAARVPEFRRPVYDAVCVYFERAIRAQLSA